MRHGQILFNEHVQPITIVNETHKKPIHIGGSANRYIHLNLSSKIFLSVSLTHIAKALFLNENETQKKQKRQKSREEEEGKELIVYSWVRAIAMCDGLWLV